jgi:hypothetical protein
MDSLSRNNPKSSRALVAAQVHPIVTNVLDHIWFVPRLICVKRPVPCTVRMVPLVAIIILMQPVPLAVVCTFFQLVLHRIIFTGSKMVSLTLLNTLFLFCVFSLFFLVRHSDSQQYFYTVEECVAGKYGNDRSSFSCADDYPDFPNCEKCGSFTLCVKDQKSCAELGLQHLEDAQPGTPEQYPLLLQSRAGVQCLGATTNFNYYTESCFNTTHVQITQGECVNGAKIRDQEALRSCQVYGEDANRNYCHQCGASVTCSSQRESHLECLQSQSSPAMLGTCPNPDSNTALSIPPSSTSTSSSSDLSSSFGCLDDQTFYTNFATCQNGQFVSEKNGFICVTTFPGYSYCLTCHGVNICSAQQTTCEALGITASTTTTTTTSTPTLSSHHNDIHIAAKSRSHAVSWRMTWTSTTTLLLIAWASTGLALSFL